MLWLVKGLGPGGMERLLLHQAQASGGEVDYMVGYVVDRPNSLEPDLAEAGVRSVRLGTGTVARPAWVRDLRRVVRRERIDVVHVHSPLVAAVARVALRAMRGGPRIVYTEHNSWTSHGRVTRALNRCTYPLDHERFAVSSEARDSSGRWGRRTEVLLHGIDVEGIRTAAARQEVRREMGLDESAYVVGIAANLRETKAYPVLLDAVALLRVRDVDVTVLCMGQGPLEAELRRIAERLDLGRSFRFLGHRSDVARVLSACDVFTLCSDDEGLPLSVMEAKALGLPVVATSVGGLPQIVEHDGDGLLVPRRRPDALASALASLAASPELRSRLGAASAASAARFDRQGFVDRLESAYLRAGARRRFRLLYVIDSFAAGGAESSLCHMIPFWSAEGTDVHVAVLHDRGDLREAFERSGATLHVGLGERRAGTRNLVRLIRALRPDLVHTTLFESDLAGQVAAAWCRVPSLTTWATTSYTQLTPFAAAVRRPRLVAAWIADVASVHLASRVHAVSDAVAAWNGPRLGRRHGITVVPRGRPAELTALAATISSSEIRHSLRIPQDHSMITVIARHERIKGIDTVIEAVSLLGPRHPASLVVVGRVGGDTDRLVRLVERLELQDRVHLLGARSDVLELLAASDLLVSGSRAEGLPGVALEAMAIGVPIVAADIPAMREALGGAERLVPVDDPAALAAAIGAQLDGVAPDDVARLRQRFLDRYTLESASSRMRALQLLVASTARRRRRWRP
ncbi:MAG: glycosyltransferase [Actinomycetota bacterium]|nr:glycosyltransferase [Actinomycetota bacterium]